jgi:septal ring factor EnvC (AmiA/AmiB activator)
MPGTQDNILSYESICTLVGRLILQHHLQIEQLGKNISQAQKSQNEARDELAKLRAENARLKHELEQYNDSSGKRVDSE